MTEMDLNELMAALRGETADKIGSPGPGQTCPLCGKKQPMTGAQRQALYRRRHKDKE